MVGNMVTAPDEKKSITTRMLWMMGVEGNYQWKVEKVEQYQNNLISSRGWICVAIWLVLDQEPFFGRVVIDCVELIIKGKVV